MRCPACARNVEPTARFCIHCASSLPRACSACGSENAPEARFCGQCAEPLRGEESAARSLAKPATDQWGHGRDEWPTAEYRQLTVMFCDLVDSTSLAERFDPEELRDLVRAYQAACSHSVGSFDGRVAQYLRDGVLVYFGYPQAHEDDPTRCVRAALAILDEIPRLRAPVSARTPELAVRIGIHTGSVVVGEVGSEGGRTEQLAMGDTVNIASRLLGEAEPGQIVVSEVTKHRIEDEFDFEALGLRRLRGITNPIEVHRVVRPKPPSRAGWRAARRNATSLVGREQELVILSERWERVERTGGQALLVSGEPGVGKSRLLRAFRERWTGRDGAWLAARCSPEMEHSAFQPIVELLEQSLGFEPDASVATRVEILDAKLDARGSEARGWLPLLAEVLNLSEENLDVPALSSPELQRGQMMEAVLGWLVGLEAHEPRVIVVEDLHWIDASSLELLSKWIERIGATRTLLLMTTRPTSTPPWNDPARVPCLALNPLSRRQVQTLVSEIASQHTLPPAVLDQIVEKTDGIPLFAEELTKTILEMDLADSRSTSSSCATNDRELLEGPGAIPSTLRDSLMARIDRLGSTRELLQLASALGREFTFDLIAVVSRLDDRALRAALEALEGAGMLLRNGTDARPSYTFKHALIQDTAYHSLLKRTRRHVHERVACALLEHFPDRVVSHPEVVARHYELSNQIHEAVTHYHRAGERAARRAASPEALNHLRQGIGLLHRMPEDARRTQLELELRVALGARLLETSGYGNPEIEEEFARARELCGHAEDVSQFFRTLWGLSVYYQSKNELTAAIELGEQCLDLAEHAGDTSLLIMAHMAIGSPLNWRAAFARSIDHTEMVIRLYDPEQHRALAQLYGEDPGISSRCYAAQSLWQLGRTLQCQQRINEAIAIARDGKHAFSLGYALSFGALIFGIRIRDRHALILATEAISVANEHDLPIWLGLSHIVRGWVTLELPDRDPQDAVAEMEAGLAVLGGIGLRVGSAALIAMLAEGYARVGRREQALALLESTLEDSSRCDSHFWDVDIHRLMGEILLTGPGASRVEAERWLRDGLALAHEQGARALGLRIAISLAAALYDDGRSSEARSLLQPAYEAIEEGPDEPDMRRARKLLEVL